MKRNTMSQSLFCSLVIVLLSTVPILTACTSTTQPITTPSEIVEPPLITSHGIGPNEENECLTCHGPGVEAALIQEGLEFPKDHVGRTNDVCFTCHEVENSR